MIKRGKTVGNKVKMSEVHDLKDSISKSLQSLSSNTNTLKTKLNDLKSNNNFKGQTAEVLIVIMTLFILKL